LNFLTLRQAQGMLLNFQLSTFHSLPLRQKSPFWTGFTGSIRILRFFSFHRCPSALIRVYDSYLVSREALRICSAFWWGKPPPYSFCSVFSVPSVANSSLVKPFDLAQGGQNFANFWPFFCCFLLSNMLKYPPVCQKTNATRRRRRNNSYLVARASWIVDGQ